LIFHQLIEAESSTYTYLIADSAGREALLIDPVLEIRPAAGVTTAGEASAGTATQRRPGKEAGRWLNRKPQ
jgi:hypothetical protein